MTHRNHGNKHEHKWSRISEHHKRAKMVGEDRKERFKKNVVRSDSTG